MTVSKNEQAILDWLAGERGAMIGLLEELVNIDGGSYDKAGVDQVGTRLPAADGSTFAAPGRRCAAALCR